VGICFLKECADPMVNALDFVFKDTSSLKCCTEAEAYENIENIENTPVLKFNRD